MACNGRTAPSGAGSSAGAEAKPSSTAQAPVAKDVRGEEVAYEVEGVQLKGYLAYDASQQGPRPGVLVVHEWWGHNDYVRRRAKMLAELGYTALAVDMYGGGKLAEHPDDAKKFMMEVLSNIAVGEARFRAARALLSAHESTDPEKVAAIGYCFGGGVVLHMARTGADLDGVASFHGSLSTQSPAQPGAVKAHVFVAHGGADPFVPADQVEAFKKEMASAGVDLQFVAYEDAKHGFTVAEATEKGERMELPLAYDAAADADSWARLQAFLAEVFAE